MKYLDDIISSMNILAEKPETFFIGQAVCYPGTGMTQTLANVPKSKMLELPVTEEMQLGMSIGMSLEGFIPISIYPRWNFLLLATNQLVNHLDKLPIYSYGEFRPGVIIRTAVGSIDPLDPQAQHRGAEFTAAFRHMLHKVELYNLDTSDKIIRSYEQAYEHAKQGVSSILVEYPDKYNQ